MEFTFEGFVAAVREAEGSQAVRQLLASCVADPTPILARTPDGGEDEVMLFEDEGLSIWRCRFQPHVVMPPHEHRLPVHIAVYGGAEKNIMFERRGEHLVHRITRTIAPGEVVTLEDDAIHAVTAAGDEPSLALHVYMGPLMTLKRDLFNWETGQPVDFSMENFDSMKRPSAALADY